MQEPTKETEQCAICSSADTATEQLVLPDNGRLLTIQVCSQCRHATAVTDRNLEANLQLQSEIFERCARAPKGPHRWPSRYALIASEIRRLLGDGGRVLDIGCGSGLWLATLGSNWEKQGVELSPAAARIARDFAGAQVFCGPIEEMEKPARPFDLITAFAVVEHLLEPRRLTRFAYDNLRPGGLFVVMTGDRESLDARRKGPAWPLYASVEHVHFFTARSLSLLLTQGGFQVLRMEWRYMPYGNKVPLGERLRAKLNDVFRHVRHPRYDHLYVYAQKPVGETGETAGKHLLRTWALM